MALIRFDDGSSVMDSTPVENMFILEYMLHAPGDYVKVYIYALMLCYHPNEKVSIAQMAKDLDLSVEDTEKAFDYWVRQGIARKVADHPPEFVLRLSKQVSYELATNPGEREYNRSFSEEVQRILGDQFLSYADYQRIYDWIDVFNIPEDVVLYLLKFEKKDRKRVSIAVAEKKVKKWSQSGIRTVEEAEKLITFGKKQDADLKKVLNRLGQIRSASEDEKEMYAKWTDHWGFSSEAILEACRETTKGSPTMAYLDGILRKQHEKGRHNAEEMNSGLRQDKEERSFVKSLFLGLGRAGSVPSDEDVKLIDDWKDKGFSEEYIFLAVQTVHRRTSAGTLEDVDHQIERWQQRGLTDAEKVKLEAVKIREKNAVLREVFSNAGIEKSRPSEQDRIRLTEWMENMKMGRELVMLAAQYAAGSPAQMSAIHTILTEWHNAGLSTLEQAQAEHASHVKRITKKSETAPADYTRHSVEERLASSRAAVVLLDEEE